MRADQGFPFRAASFVHLAVLGAESIVLLYLLRRGEKGEGLKKECSCEER